MSILSPEELAQQDRERETEKMRGVRTGATPPAQPPPDRSETTEPPAPPVKPVLIKGPDRNRAVIADPEINKIKTQPGETSEKQTSTLPAFLIKKNKPPIYQPDYKPYIPYKGEIKIKPSITSAKSTSLRVTPDNIASFERQTAMTTALTLGAIPVIGTAIYWDRMKPHERALSMGLDLLSVTPLPGKAWQAVKTFYKGPAAGADDALKALRAANRADLKALTNKTVVKSYDDVIKAGNKYSKNLAEIENTQALIKNRFGGPLEQDYWTLTAAKKQTAALKNNLVTAGETLSKNIRSSGFIKNTKRIGSDIPGFADDYGKQYAADIENLIKTVYNKPPDIKSSITRINKFKKQIEVALHDKDKKRIADLLSKVPEINAEARLVHASKARQLATSFNTTFEDIANIKLRLKTERLTVFKRTQLERQLSIAENKLPRIKTAMEKAYRYLDMDTAPDIPRSSGKGGITTSTKPSKVGPKPATMAGGGVKQKTKGVILIPLIGTKPIVIDNTALPETEVLPVPDTTTNPKPGVTPDDDTGPGPKPNRVPGKKDDDDPSRTPSPKPDKERERTPDKTPDRTPSKTPNRTPAPTPDKTPAPQPDPTPAPQPDPTPAPTPDKTPVPTDTPTLKPPVKMFYFNQKKTDAKNRKLARLATVKMGWRQGELQGKNVFHVIIEPFTSKEQYLIIRGKRPAGVPLYRGPRSAIRSAVKVTGRETKGGVIDQPGLFSVKVEPISQTGKLDISFVKDSSISGKNSFPLP